MVLVAMSILTACQSTIQAQAMAINLVSKANAEFDDEQAAELSAYQIIEFPFELY
jgi:hypothetical protein